MGEQSKIQWTHHTFNPWWGCQRVSPGCQHCYAETFDKRVGGNHWGPTAERRTFGPKHWNEPLKWAREAAKAGERHRVFCASMADVFEDRPELETERQKLWELIRETAFTCEKGCSFTDCYPKSIAGATGVICRICVSRGGMGGLDWLLLTKRPENVLRMAPADILPLVWVGTTVEDQERADQRIPELLRIPARVRFLSMEPLLGPVNLDLPRCETHDREFAAPDPELGECCTECAADGWSGELSYGHWLFDEHESGINWVIVGGESGPGARPFDLAWARTIRDQCASAGVPVFVKQFGAVVHETVPSEMGAMGPHLMERKLVDRKGGDPTEWPGDLRVRQFPEVAHGR